jgi:hypothetical protein
MHCQTAINVQTVVQQLGNDSDCHWRTETYRCPECGKVTVSLVGFQPTNTGEHIVSRRVVRPRASLRTPAPADVPDELRELYDEASAIAPLSPRAAGALGRRALQQLIREHAGISKRDLATEIDELVASGGLPSHLTELLHAVRQVGNFSAHPMKSTNTGEIIDVEPGEVELVFDVLDGLFDFYFVQPAVTAKRKADLNTKLREAGKPEV